MRTPIPIRVTATQRKHLESLRDSTTDRRLWSRIVAILMSAAGTPAQQITSTLGVTAQSVSNWRNRWNRGGPFDLKDRPRSGGPRRVTAKYIELMEEAVDREPQAYGYVFTTWSVKRLTAHLKRKTRIQMSSQRVRQLLHERGFVCRRPKHTLKGKRDERHYQKVKKQLEVLKRGP